ncbi:hypothetical protein [Salinicola avicenniae]|uniref:hypothetical protein n=1 Tax=Salinicola avicenniae TaxID=2916836 RepID=UPI002072B6EB|nr:MULTISPECIES: hypothetical protein [unclassified Salinicola]
MQVQYLGPLMMGHGHPALTGYDLDSFPANYFAVELGEQAGCDGSLIEGDVLIADESRAARNNDLTVADINDDCQLGRIWRIGGRVRFIPMYGRESLFIREDMLLGVVVNLARQYVA